MSWTHIVPFQTFRREVDRFVPQSGVGLDFLPVLDAPVLVLTLCLRSCFSHFGKGPDPLADDFQNLRVLPERGVYFRTDCVEEASPLPLLFIVHALYILAQRRSLGVDGVL